MHLCNNNMHIDMNSHIHVDMNINMVFNMISNIRRNNMLKYVKCIIGTVLGLCALHVFAHIFAFTWVSFYKYTFAWAWIIVLLHVLAMKRVGITSALFVNMFGAIVLLYVNDLRITYWQYYYLAMFWVCLKIITKIDSYTNINTTSNA